MPTNADLISGALQEFPVSTPPRRLLRFFRAGDGLRFLGSGRINLTPPTAFNDPFELCAAVPRRVISIDEMRACLLKRNGLLRVAYQQNHGPSEDDYERWVEECALKQPQHWRESCHHAVEGFQRVVAEIVGLICFMALEDAEPDAPHYAHQWNHYAENHHGIAVEFDPCVGLLQVATEAKWLFPVNYYRLHERPEWDLGTTMDEVLHELRLRASQKAEVWREEREWRMIAPFDAEKLRDRLSTHVEGEQFRHLLALWIPGEKSFVTRVYLGFRASEELERGILAACSHPRLEHVEVLRAEPSQRDYSISYHPVL